MIPYYPLGTYKKDGVVDKELLWHTN
jgi:hypothetical protein